MIFPKIGRRICPADKRIEADVFEGNAGIAIHIQVRHMREEIGKCAVNCDSQEGFTV